MDLLNILLFMQPGEGEEGGGVLYGRRGHE